MLVSAPPQPHALINAAVRSVGAVDYASPHQDASEGLRGNVVVWSVYDGSTRESFQNVLAGTWQVSFHVGSESFSGAAVLAGDVWAALVNAPFSGVSVPGSTERIVAVTGDDLPVENRTAGQLLDYFEFQFTLYITTSS